MLSKSMSSLFFFICCLSLLALTAQAQERFNARSGRVFDGDSLLVKKNGDRRWTDVRLLGIDAPEKEQNFGAEATEFLKNLLQNQQLEVEVLKSDNHGRPLVTIYVDNININLLMLEAGYAWFNRPFGYELSRRLRNIYKAAADQAKSQRLGLWIESQPMAPWTYRRQHHRTSFKGQSYDNVCTAYLSDF